MRWWLAAPCALVPVAWIVGQMVRDTWEWSQLLFWIPAPMVAAAAAGAAWLLRGADGRGWRAVRLASAGACVWAVAHTLWWSLGWGWSAAEIPPAGPDAARSVTVVHWNPRAPGDRALECAQALLAAEGDVYILSNPGQMLRGECARAWVPAGWHVAETPFVGVVARWPVRSLRMVASPSGPPSGAMWAAHAELDGGPLGPLSVLVVDFPSNPTLPRGSAMAEATGWFAELPGAAHPDLLVGDFNSIEGSRLFQPWPENAPAEPWRSAGWLGTFPRSAPVFRIDWMRAGPELRWRRYETLDLGTGLHRAQRGVLERNHSPGTPAE